MRCPPRIVRAAAPAPALEAAFGIGACAIRGGETPWRQSWFGGQQTVRLTELLRREAAGGTILVLSPEILAIYPAVTYAHVRPTPRSMRIRPRQRARRACPNGALPQPAPSAMGASEWAMWRSVAEDFGRAPPRAVLVWRQAQIRACGERFDLIAYFATHPVFARTWQHDRPAGETEGCRLFVRNL
jgi:hypothetical protein